MNIIVFPIVQAGPVELVVVIDRLSRVVSLDELIYNKNLVCDVWLWTVPDQISNPLSLFLDLLWLREQVLFGSGLDWLRVRLVLAFADKEDE